jgi:hypothetical protein
MPPTIYFEEVVPGELTAYVLKHRKRVNVVRVSAKNLVRATLRQQIRDWLKDKKALPASVSDRIVKKFKEARDVKAFEHIFPSRPKKRTRSEEIAFQKKKAAEIDAHVLQVEVHQEEEEEPVLDFGSVDFVPDEEETDQKDVALQKLRAVKCDLDGASTTTQWSKVTIVLNKETGDYDLKEKKKNPEAPKETPVSDALRVKGKLRKDVNPYAQVWSMLSTLNWAGGSSEWLQGRGLDPRNYYVLDTQSWANQVGGFSAGLEATRGKRFSVFTKWLNALNPGTPWITKAEHWKDHVCAWAQMVRVGKELYAKYLQWVGVTREVTELESCDPPDQELIDKRNEYRWTLYAGSIVPLFLYLEAWARFYQEYDEAIGWTWWRKYLEVSLEQVKRARERKKDQRLALQDEQDPEDLATDVGLMTNMAALKDKMPATGAHSALVMPGPAPWRSLSKKKVYKNWKDYWADYPLPAGFTAKGYKLRKYEIVEETGKLKRPYPTTARQSKESVMFGPMGCGVRVKGGRARKRPTTVR